MLGPYRINGVTITALCQRAVGRRLLYRPMLVIRDRSSDNLPSASGFALALRWQYLLRPRDGPIRLFLHAPGPLPFSALLLIVITVISGSCSIAPTSGISPCKPTGIEQAGDEARRCQHDARGFIGAFMTPPSQRQRRRGSPAPRRLLEHGSVVRLCQRVLRLPALSRAIHQSAARACSGRARAALFAHTPWRHLRERAHQHPSFLSGIGIRIPAGLGDSEHLIRWSRSLSMLSQRRRGQEMTQTVSHPAQTTMRLGGRDKGGFFTS